MEREPLNCETCHYANDCEKVHGAKRDDGDDFRAVIGTHFCRASWDGFKCGCQK